MPRKYKSGSGRISNRQRVMDMINDKLNTNVVLDETQSYNMIFNEMKKLNIDNMDPDDFKTFVINKVGLTEEQLRPAFMDMKNDGPPIGQFAGSVLRTASDMKTLIDYVTKGRIEGKQQSGIWDTLKRFGITSSSLVSNISKTALISSLTSLATYYPDIRDNVNDIMTEIYNYVYPEEQVNEVQTAPVGTLPPQPPEQPPTTHAPPEPPKPPRGTGKIRDLINKILESDVIDDIDDPDTDEEYSTPKTDLLKSQKYSTGDIKKTQEQQESKGFLKPKFIIPSANLFNKSIQEEYIDDIEFTMFDFVKDDSGGLDPNNNNFLLRDQQMTEGLRYQNAGVNIPSLYGKAPKFSKELFIPKPEYVKLPEISFLYGDAINQFNLSEFETSTYDVNNDRIAIDAKSPYYDMTDNQLLDEFIDTSILYGVVP